MGGGITGWMKRILYILRIKSKKTQKGICCLKFFISPGSLFFRKKTAIEIVKICCTIFLNDF